MSEPRIAGPAGRPPHIALLAYDGVLGSAVAGPFDVLGGAGILWPQFRDASDGDPVFTLSTRALAPGTVECGFGLKLAITQALDDPPLPDVVIVPTFVPPTPWQERLALHPQQQALLPWLVERARAGAIMCSTSTGSLLLAQAGLLEGLEATTHWSLLERARLWFPGTRFRLDRALVASGANARIVTAGGGTCWQDLVLHLIARFAGRVVAGQTARMFTIFGRHGGQLPFAEWLPRLDHGDASVLAAQRWMNDDHRGNAGLAGAIAASGLAERTFKRRFRLATGLPPNEYLQRVRIQQARFLLETSRLGVEDVAAEVGYGDVAFFRTLFARIVGTTPAEYRRQFALPLDELESATTRR